MDNPCGKFKPDNTRSAIGKGQKTKRQVKKVFGKSNTTRKFITGG